MQFIYSNYSASISDLKKNPTALLRESSGNPIAILNHNKPTAYLLSSDVYEGILEALDEKVLSQIIASRTGEMDQAFEVSIDEL